MTTTDTIPVPRRLLEELASYLSRASEPTVSVPENGEWSRTMVEQMRAEVTRYAGATAALDLAAQRAGEPVSLDDIERISGLTRKQISSDLGGMSKAARRLFNEKIWPMRAMQANSGMNYLMRKEIAEWWLQ